MRINAAWDWGEKHGVTAKWEIDLPHKLAFHVAQHQINAAAYATRLAAKPDLTSQAELVRRAHKAI